MRAEVLTNSQGQQEDFLRMVLNLQISFLIDKFMGITMPLINLRKI
jgi:hypothetical protein